MSALDGLKLGPQWLDVTLVYADGTEGPAKAAYSGEGWCDVVSPMGADGYARSWVRADGTAQLPMNPVQLARPFTHYQIAPAVGRPAS